MRILVAAMLALLLPFAAAQLPAVPPIPQPGLIPLVDDAVATVNDATASLPGGQAVADATSAVQQAFHDRASKPTRFAFDPAAPVHDIADETTVATGLDFRTKAWANYGPGFGMGGFRSGDSYQFEAEGTFTFHSDTRHVADAECSQEPGDAVWKPARYTAQYGQDLVDLTLVMGGATAVYVDWVPNQPFAAGSGHSADCSSDHRYTATVTVTDWWLAAAISDPSPGDNGGYLDVRATGGPPQYPAPYACPEWVGETPPATQHIGWVGELDETTIPIDSHRDGNVYPNPKNFAHLQPWNEAGHNGIYTCAVLVPWETYDITVSGSYTYASPNPLNRPGALLFANVPPPSSNPAGITYWTNFIEREADLGTTFDAPLADAECAQGLADDVWMSHRPEYHLGFFDKGELRVGEDYLDLSLNELWVKWFPKSGGDSGCDPNHEYVIEGYSPDRVGPLHLWLKDSRYSENDNYGVLQVTIKRT